METLSEIFIVLAYIAAIGFFVFGLDDLLFDYNFIRYLRRTRNAKHTTLEDLRNKPEKHIAVFVPAWSEGGIVNRMADYAVKILEYERYDIFIGVYPNDPETIGCVEAIAKTCPRIHMAMCPDPGPTSKADCLNAIYRAMQLREIPGVREYGIIALHDSEDILHPLTLKIYNYFVPDSFDMGQIPVFPLELSPWNHWVGNTYMDEFSELHLKDMFARQEIGGVVPSAGVGTAFDRAAIDYLADHNGGNPFVVGNLTEDYFIGIQLKRAGFRCGFINYPIDRVVVKKNDDGKVVSRDFVTEIVAVREHFPTQFWGAVRQRSRWILGIAMQCWELAGWSGSLAVRYTLARDRRAPLTHMINAIGYVVIFSWLIETVFRKLPIAATQYWRPLFTMDSFLWTLILVDTCLLFYRLVVKAYFVSEIYGWKQGLFAIPRYPVGNFINFFATCRALWMYINGRLFGKQVVWLKTTHVFPTTGDLSAFAASIEDLLMQDKNIPRERLEQLVRSGGDTSIPSTLLALRLMDEEQFTGLWSRYSGIPQATVLPDDADLGLLAKVPEPEALSRQMLPIRDREDGSVEIAFLEPPSPSLRDELEARFSRPVSAVLVTPTNMRMLRDRLYSTRAMPRGRASFSGSIERIDPQKWRELRTLQFRTGNRISDLLFDAGLASAEQCRSLWCEIFAAEPCDITAESLDPDAFAKLGPLFCDLHRIAPLHGRKLVMQDVIHPRTMADIEARLGWRPSLVTDRAQPVRNFLRGVSGSLDPEKQLIEQMVSAGTMSAADAAELRSLKTLVRDPAHMLARRLGMATQEAFDRAFAKIASLPSADGGHAEPVAEGVLRPDFEQDTRSRILEARDGRVTIALTCPLSPQDFSHICSRLMRCAVRFVQAPYSS